MIAIVNIFYVDEFSTKALCKQNQLIRLLFPAFGMTNFRMILYSPNMLTQRIIVLFS